MIFADKLRELRKKNGWSQEELAEKMEVTRQSVSKWEGAQAIPDLEKILKLSNLFGVSTDYLLKDEIGDSQEELLQGDKALRQVSMEETVKFLEIKEQTSKYIAYATFLCIISPIPLIILGAIGKKPNNLGAGVGLIVLFILVAIAVAIFIISGSKTKDYDFLNYGNFEIPKVAFDLVKDRKKQYKNTYLKNNIIGVVISIMSMTPVFLGLFLENLGGFVWAILISIMFILIGIGTILFIESGIMWASFGKLLKEEEYAKVSLGKKKKYALEPLRNIYWTLVVCIYLGYSLITSDWERSWIIWVVASLLFTAFIAIIKYKDEIEDNN